MLFDIHSDLFMDVDNRRAGGSRSVISENHSERLKEGGVTSMFNSHSELRRFRSAVHLTF